MSNYLIMVKYIFTLLFALGVSALTWGNSRTNYELITQVDGTSINIQWRTLNIYNVERYEVYKLNQDEDWEILETVIHEDHITTWTVLDTHPKDGENSYLLRAVEMTELPHFSGIVTVEFEIPQFEVLVYPNPASDWIVINSNENSSDFNAELVNRFGISVAKEKSNKGSIVLDTSNIIEGIYYVKINNSKMKYDRPVIINHR